VGKEFAAYTIADYTVVHRAVGVKKFVVGQWWQNGHVLGSVLSM